MTRPLKPTRCPVCKRRMSRAGETFVGKVVWSCPWCLIVVASGGKRNLKTPLTPPWVKTKEPPRRLDRP